MKDSGRGNMKIKKRSGKKMAFVTSFPKMNNETPNISNKIEKPELEKT
jgi:hypothetical protein